MKKLEIEELLDYLDNSLPQHREKEIDRILLKNTFYFNILKGLQVLKEKFVDKKSILSFLAKEGSFLKNRIFNDSSQGSLTQSESHEKVES